MEGLVAWSRLILAPQQFWPALGLGNLTYTRFKTVIQYTSSYYVCGIT